MRLIPGPGDLAQLADRGYSAAQTAISLVPRLVALLDAVEVIVARVDVVVDDIDRTRTEADAVVRRTNGVVAEAAELTARLGPLVDRFEPTLDKLEPITARIVATTDPDEVEAMIRLIDTLPLLVAKIDADILPILDTLATVAPDLRDLLDASRELNEMMGSVPGLGRIKRRIEEHQAQEDEYRADHEPPSSPERR